LTANTNYTGWISTLWRPGKRAPRKKHQDFTGWTVQGKAETSPLLTVSEKTGAGIKRIVPEEFWLDCEAKGGRIHARAWAGNKVMPQFQAWGLIVFFSFKRFHWDENRIYHVEIP